MKEFATSAEFGDRDQYHSKRTRSFYQSYDYNNLNKEEPLTLVWAAARGARKLTYIQWGDEPSDSMGRTIAQRVVKRGEDGSVRDLIKAPLRSMVIMVCLFFFDFLVAVH